MTEYNFRYSLLAPQARLNGGRHIAHDLQAEAAVEGTEEWEVIRHKTVLLPADDVIAALATGTTGDKATAYKQLLAANIDTMDTSVEGWGLAQLQLLLDNNETSVAAAAAITDFVMNDLPLEKRQFPVKFTM